MQITAKFLDDEIDAIDKRIDQETATLNALSGARQVLSQLRARLDTPEPPPAPKAEPQTPAESPLEDTA